MSLDSYFSVTVKAANVSVGRKGFGMPMLVGYHVYWPEKVRTFGELSELTDLNMPVTHPIYKMALALKSAEPCPPQFKVGKRAETGNVHTFRITPDTPALNEKFEFNVGTNGVATTAISHTATTPTVAAVCTALQALFDAVTGITATDNTTYIQVTTEAAEKVIDLEAISQNVTIKDESTDPGIATDLAAIEALDPEWYFLALDRQSEAEILAAAAWAEAAKKIFVPSCGDTEIKDAGTTTDVASDLQTGNYTRTLFTYSDAPHSYPGLAMAGMQGPKAPGGTNWAWQKAPGGSKTTTLTTGEKTALDAKYANYITQVNSVASYFWGKTSGNEWVDVVRGSDWFKARLQERLHALFLNAEKVPFTAEGIELIGSEVASQFKDAHAAGVTDPAVDVVVTLPEIADISSADFASRTLPLTKAKGRLAGAINKGSFEITLYQ